MNKRPPFFKEAGLWKVDDYVYIVPYARTRNGVSKVMDIVHAVELELSRWLQNNATASPGDRAAAENIIRDMQDALMGK